jgi:SWI/SNF-related matrix-associated actin-dependent regulator 1 of chromatin subfamily A
MNPNISFQEVDDIPPLPDLKVEIRSLKRALFPYQEKGVAYALEKKRLIVGDQPGLGKTGQAIATITAAAAFPCLVVCPSTLKQNWLREWAIWTGKKAMILENKYRNSWPNYTRVGAADIIIVNYESLKKYFVEGIYKEDNDAPLKLQHIAFKNSIHLFRSVIIDESHRVKDGATQQAKYLMGICRGKEWILALTGTPVINRPIDLVSQLYIIERLKDFGGYSKFIDRYCAGGKGADNLAELNYKLNTTCFYRREKTEVLADLPPKIRQVLSCQISTREEYEIAEKDFVRYLREIKGCSDREIRRKLTAKFMVQIGILKNISARGKLAEVIEYVEEITDAGEKVILFVHLREVGEAIKRAFPDAGVIAGGIDHEARQRAVDRFQNDPNMKVIICSIRAAGVGLTLTASSRVGFVEFPWTFADCEQCEDRAHRIGQRDSVQCTYFLGDKTIDEYCYEIIQKKKSIAREITGATDDVEEEFIDNLLEILSKK